VSPQNLHAVIEAGQDPEGQLKGVCEEAELALATIPPDAVDEEDDDVAVAASRMDDD
jgi:hypothetical protein